MSKSNGIGELAESSLHHSLKEYYQTKGAQLEAQLDGYVIDVQTPTELIEIQTSSFSSVKKKYNKLLTNHEIRMVYPIAKKKIIVKHHRDGRIERRKSPKSGNIFELFRELVYIPKLINHPNFSLEVAFTHEEEIRKNDGKGSWRRKGWSVTDHKLLEVVDTVKFTCPGDFSRLLPGTLPNEFTTAHITKNLKIPKYMAQKLVYCLKGMGLLEKIGKDGRYNLYVINQSLNGD